MNRPLKFAGLAVLAACLLAACSLAGDVTPPPGSSVQPQPGGEPTLAPAATETGLTFTPSAAEGAAVYADHCIRCHGPAGQGDGDLAAQLQVPPADFTDLERLRNATPAGWYEMVTQGNLERFMPPFADALTDTQRWNVTYYLFTLGTPPEAIEAGQAVYVETCAACHGPSGQGDGPDADPNAPPPDLSDTAAWLERSQADFFAAITSGHAPAFAETLTDEDRWAASAYVQTFAYEYLAPGAELPVGEGTVAGEVVNGTSGQAAPAGLAVVLYGFDDFQLAIQITETLAAGGVFEFTEVPYVPGRSFLVLTEYEGVSYNSEILSFSGGAKRLEALVNVYENTTDPAGLVIDRLHIFFDFPGEGRATVGELFVISNTGDRTVLGGPAVQFSLPPGAADLQIQGATAGEDYGVTPEGFSLARPIVPGLNTAQLLISFSLPYTNRLEFSQVMPFPATTVNVLAPEVGVRVQGEALASDGVQDVEGVRYLSYTASNLPAGGTLAFDVTSGPATSQDLAGLIVGALVLASVVGGVGWWYYARRPVVAAAASRPARPNGREALLQAAADLDDEFAAGGLPRSDYERRRADLKARLLASWKQDRN